MIFGLMQCGLHSPWLLVLCWRLAESNVTVTLEVKHVGWLCLWYNYVAHVVSTSTSLAFLTNFSEEHKSTSRSVFQVKNWWMIICIEEKLDIISWLGKGERTFDTWCNVRFTHSINTKCDNGGRFTEGAKSRPKVLMSQVYHSPVGMNRVRNYGCEFMTISFH
jgi:hypothetical protein